MSDSGSELTSNPFVYCNIYLYRRLILTHPIMSLNAVRNFSSTAKRNLLKLIGKVSLEDVKKINGSKGEQWVSSVEKMRDDVETQVTML